MLWRALLIMFVLFPIRSLAGNQIQLESVSVHLFLEESGQLSPDITKMNEFMAWNFRAFGEGIVGQQSFSNFLVVVKLTSDSEIYRNDAVLDVRVTDRDTGELVSAWSDGSIYVGPSGTTSLPFWVSGHVCEVITVSVTLDKKTIAHDLQFRCGE